MSFLDFPRQKDPRDKLTVIARGYAGGLVFDGALVPLQNSDVVYRDVAHVTDTPHSFYNNLRKMFK